MKPLILSAFAALAVAAAAADEAPPMSAEECAVWNRELSFAKSVDNHDAKAFAAHIHPGAVFAAATANPTRGRDAIVESWAALLEGKTVQLVWRPQFVSVGSNANVAISRGPFYVHNSDPKARAAYAVGTFTSVWGRANARAPWQVLFDGGGPPPTPVAGEAEALAHLAKAPATCPMK